MQKIHNYYPKVQNKNEYFVEFAGGDMDEILEKIAE